jgi:hypothetical protein
MDRMHATFRMGSPRPEPSWYMGTIHDGNTCPKALNTKYFAPRECDLSLELGADWPFYQSLREKMGVAA